MGTRGVHRLARGAAAALWVASVAGCSAITMPSFLDFSGTAVRWTHVTLAAATDANRNSPVAVDLVLVTEQAVWDEIVTLSSAKWFALRNDLVKTHPRAFVYRSWELVPGQMLTIDGEALGRRRVVGALAFADYAAPGAHRARIDTFTGRIVVRLDAEDLSVSSSAAP